MTREVIPFTLLVICIIIEIWQITRKNISKELIEIGTRWEKLANYEESDRLEKMIELKQITTRYLFFVGISFFYWMVLLVLAFILPGASGFALFGIMFIMSVISGRFQRSTSTDRQYRIATAVDSTISIAIYAIYISRFCF